MINLKPSLGNNSNGVENIQTQEVIRSIIKELVV